MGSRPLHSTPNVPLYMTTGQAWGELLQHNFFPFPRLACAMVTSGICLSFGIHGAEAVC